MKTKTKTKMKKLVLTGAAGRLGSHLRGPLSQLCEQLLSTDQRAELPELLPNESYRQAQLQDLASMLELTSGADMVVHFGAIGDEAPFAEILESNILGAYNVWEAAAQNKVRRVIYASSIHAVGMHSRTQGIGLDARHRPDTYYGLAKCFAEDLASLYWDKHQLEAVCLRILSCAQVNSARALGTWLSVDDLVHLVTQAIVTPVTEFSVIYGVSNNDRCPVDNRQAAFLGYRPQDNAEQFAQEVLANAPSEDPGDLQNRCLGGPFASVALGESGVASMNIVDELSSDDS